MTAATAWAEAMKYEHRADPYPYFDQLRRTPVARVADDLYVVTGYQELLTLAHDPRVSSDISRSPLGNPLAGTDAASTPPPHTRPQSIIASDPPAHDRARRQVMRHFGPPHSPAWNPSSSGCATSCSTTSRQAARRGWTWSTSTPIRYR
nr:cytochrome P450 [Nocardia mikamii]